MQGKFVFSQSPSTFLFLNRFSMQSVPVLAALERQKAQTRGAPTLRRSPGFSSSLLTQGELRFATAGSSHRLRLILGAFVPHHQGVAAVGNVFDLVIAAVVGFGKIRSR